MQTIVYIWLIVLGLTEAYISIRWRSNKNSRKTAFDRFSLLILWITVPTCIGISILFIELNSISIPLSPIFFIGLAFSFLGSLIRWSSIYQLKHAFTVDVSIVSDHTLTTTGLYTYLRHPSYTGLLLNYIGIWMAMQNIYLFTGCSIVVILALNYRIIIEERVLLGEFGEQYERFKEQTKRLIPFIY